MLRLHDVVPTCNSSVKVWIWDPEKAISKVLSVIWVLFLEMGHLWDRCLLSDLIKVMRTWKLKNKKLKKINDKMIKIIKNHFIIGSKNHFYNDNLIKWYGFYEKKMIFWQNDFSIIVSDMINW